MGELEHAHALQRGGHEHAEQAGARLAQLERLQRPAAHADLVGQVGQARLAAGGLGLGAEPRAERGVDEQALEQLGGDVDAVRA
ncbi:hypothetical protein [Baekduia soli]|uniref:hypothetical protein n=1 Tax=Baekduia soli TaxID=496014 RepID=UPI00165240E0|nr:hypothetical protein [Baekduia soli]